MADTQSVGVDIDAIIQQVKDAVELAGRIQAARADQESGPAVEVEKLDLTLKAFAEMSGGGEIKLRIPVVGTEFGGGSTLQREEIQTVQLTLVPPSAAVRKGLAPLDIKTTLVDAILGIEQGIRRAARTEPRFELESASVELNLVVGREGTISLAVRGSARSETTHTVRLHLRPRGGGS